MADSTGDPDADAVLGIGASSAPIPITASTGDPDADAVLHMTATGTVPAKGYTAKLAAAGEAFDKAAGSGLTGIGNTIAAALDVGTHMATSVAGDVAGAATSIFSQNPQKGAAVQKAIADVGAPTTPAGKAAEQYVGALTSPVGELLHAPVAFLQEGGHPIAAQTVQAGEDLLPAALGGKEADTARLASRASAVDLLNKEGIPTSIAQSTGSKLAQHIERASAMTGDSAAEFAGQQANGFNQAVLRRIGVMDPDVTAATPDVMADAKAKIVGVMNDVATRNHPAFDPQLQSDIQSIRADAMRQLPASDARPLEANLDDIEANAKANGGNLDGTFVQKVRSNISALRMNPGTAPLAADLQDALDNAVQRTATATGNQADVAALTKARAQYRAMKQIEPAIDPSTGDISPLRLMSSLTVKSNRPQALYGVGDQSLMDLARAAKQVLPDRLGNSGTAERMVGPLGAIETLGSGEPFKAGVKLAAGTLGLNTLGKAMRGQGLPGLAAKGIGAVSGPIGAVVKPAAKGSIAGLIESNAGQQ
jgi:hypothetical protein